MFSGTFIPPALGFTQGLAFCSSFFLSLLFFCTLKPLPSVILEEGCYHSVWGTTRSGFLSGLAAGPWHCPMPVPSLVAAALPRWDIGKVGFWMCCQGVAGKGSCAHHSSLGAALTDGSLSPSLGPAFPQLPSGLGLGRQLWNAFIAHPQESSAALSHHVRAEADAGGRMRGWAGDDLHLHICF